MKTQEGNWITRARKAAGAKGPAQAEVLEDIGQNLQVADLDKFEYDWCGAVRHLKVSAPAGPVAAALSRVTIFNPAGSSVLAFIDQIEIVSGGAGNLQVDGGFIYADTADAVLGVLPHDTRWFLTTPPPVGGLSTVIVRAGTNAADPITTRTDRYAVQSLANASVFARRIVLAPGTGYALVHQTVNTALRVDLYVKERIAASGELSQG